MQHWISSFAVINCRIQPTFWIDDKSSYRKYHTRLFIVADRTFIHGLRFNCESESHFGHCIGSSGAINTEYLKRVENVDISRDPRIPSSPGLASNADPRTAILTVAS
jgi:hypothetical protein